MAQICYLKAKIVKNFHIYRPMRDYISTYNKKRKYKENNKKNSTFVHSFNCMYNYLIKSLI